MNLSNMQSLSRVWNQVINFTKTSTSIPVLSGRWPGNQPILPNVKNRVSGIVEVYEDVIGVKSVQDAHSNVLKSEDTFLKAQEIRRRSLDDLTRSQVKLQDIRKELDRTVRGDDRYLDLVKKEVEEIRAEHGLRIKFNEEERQERDAFTVLSKNYRLSFETERAQAEKTKYWSIIGSVIGVTLGIIGSNINSYVKMNQLKTTLREESRLALTDVMDTISSEMSKLHNILEDKYDTLVPHSLTLDSVTSSSAESSSTTSLSSDQSSEHVPEIPAIVKPSYVDEYNEIWPSLTLEQRIIQLRTDFYLTTIFTSVVSIIAWRWFR